MHVVDRADAQPLVERTEIVAGDDARDEAVADRVDGCALVDPHINPGMKAFRALAPARFSERACNLVWTFERRDRPQKRLQAEPLGVEAGDDER